MVSHFVVGNPLPSTRACKSCVQGKGPHGSPRKSLFLARHHEYLCRQEYFLYKEQTLRWYIEAQQAVYQMSWMADSRRLRFRQWRTAVLPEVWSTTSRKLAAASSCCSGPIFRRPPTPKRMKRPRGGICLKCTQ